MGSNTIWLESLHATSSVLRPRHMRTNCSVGETVKDEVLSTSAEYLQTVIDVSICKDEALM